MISPKVMLENLWKFNNAIKALENIEMAIEEEYDEEMYTQDASGLVSDPYEELRSELQARIYELSIRCCEAWFQTDEGFAEWYDKYIRPYKIN